VTEREALARDFESHRGRLQGVSYRMLGSLEEAQDAVQETWLRLERADVDGIANLGGWLRTTASRICLDMLRARAARREDLTGEVLAGAAGQGAAAATGDPEREAVLAEEAGRALLVVLDALSPDERVAFVLHDMLAVPFGEIAPVVGKTAATAKKLASRARQKVRGTPAVPAAELAGHRRVVEAFLAASRAGDVDAVLAVLAPGVLRRADRAAVPEGRPAEVRGAAAVAREIAAFGQNAAVAELALINGAPGLLIAPRGRLLLALAITVEGEKLTGYDLIADPARLAALDLAALDLAVPGDYVGGSR
jgi:RNA polymerase sigma-70 factor (ECF subfamily)